jgi:regulator of ribonuclease activity A
MMDFATADLCDDLKDEVTALKPHFNSYGKRQKCKGKVSTLLIDEDNSALIELLKEDGKGRVAVVKVSGEICAVVGDKLMGIAEKNGWEGIVVDGYVRDIQNTKNIDVVLLAVDTYPKKSQKKSIYNKGCDLYIAGAKISEGDEIFIDEDGVVIKK